MVRREVGRNSEREEKTHLFHSPFSLLLADSGKITNVLGVKGPFGNSTGSDRQVWKLVFVEDRNMVVKGSCVFPNSLSLSLSLSLLLLLVHSHAPF